MWLMLLYYKINVPQFNACESSTFGQNILEICVHDRETIINYYNNKKTDQNI